MTVLHRRDRYDDVDRREDKELYISILEMYVYQIKSSCTANSLFLSVIEFI